MIVPVILSGGGGTRLWPLSREERPKPLLPLVSSKSLLQETLLRLDVLPGEVGAPLVVCNASHEAATREQLAAIDRAEAHLILEPVGRNTAPAAAVAALVAQAQAAEESPTLLILPGDHLIRDPEAFAQAVGAGISAAGEGALVTFGVVPSYPEVGYGYIKPSLAGGGMCPVEAFLEKPELEAARAYVASGDYYWNSGMFLFEAAAYLEELQRLAPEMLAACRDAVLGGRRIPGGTVLAESAFQDCPGDSIDYAVMERTDRAVVVPMDAGWCDLGTWDSVHEASGPDARGNVSRGTARVEDCRNTLVYGSHRLVVGLGLDDIVVVETPDAVLVTRRERAEDLKDLVSRLKDED